MQALLDTATCCQQAPWRLHVSFVCLETRCCACSAVSSAVPVKKKKPSAVCVQCYTFGCPYVGNHSFARQYERSVRDTWHVIHDRDLVTRSGKFLFLFKRPGCATSCCPHLISFSYCDQLMFLWHLQQHLQHCNAVLSSVAWVPF